MKWTPITFEELSIEISKGEDSMDQDDLDFWMKIKTVPEKWSEAEYGDEGNGLANKIGSTS
ncbi:hypothetical protein [Sphingobacterium faecium]|uniref:hypothetical protein n=1 Tax=Sphingobacterium faecium TaxID=34087 RepID=UPI0032096CF7